MHFYKEDYPRVVAAEVLIKTFICWAMLVVEAGLVFKLRMFQACKLAYALKLIKIFFIFYQAFVKDEIL
jgi:hypothetical protein